MNRLKTLLKKLYHNTTLFQKMIFFYIILLCVPTFFIGGFYIGSFSRQLNAQYRQGRQEALAQKRSFIATRLSRINYCTSAFQYNANLVEYVEQYDFSTGSGAQMWLASVRPAFEQIAFANPEFSNICIWRLRDMQYNAPRYVLNASDNPELAAVEPMNYRTLRLFVQEGEPIRECHVYRALFNTRSYSKIAYTEVDCDFNFLLGSLSFMKEKEQLFLTQGDVIYQVLSDAEGHIYLEVWKRQLKESVNRVSLPVEELGLVMDYYYTNLSIWSNSTLVTILISVILLFGFFSLVYYAFYRSITKRIICLTEHMQCSAKERIELYQEDPNRDEIGTMVRVYNQTAIRVNDLNEEILQKVRLVNQAQYYALQSQIQPHFLYNTLENIDMLIEVGENEQASRMMALFGKILRYNLSRHKEMTLLEEEITHIEDYLKLYSFRMRHDFYWELVVEPECGRVECPYCMLQPVVENCFKHGFQDTERELWVRIRVYRKDGYVWIEIEDNGDGISLERMRQVEQELRGEKEALEQEDTSVGLKNVQERIRILCREDSGLWISSGTQGCLVKIAIKI